MGKRVHKINPEGKRRCYSKAFKLAAVQLFQSGTKPGAVIATELGISRNMLYRWAEVLHRHNGDSDAAFHGPGRPKGSQQQSPLEAEVIRLKRELARVTEERDILKKADAYFAKVHK